MDISIRMILASDLDGIIGKSNMLPWPMIKSDMMHFKDHTLSNIVVMGMNTWNSLPQKLSDRVNCVITRNPTEAIEFDYNIVSGHSLDSIYLQLQKISKIENKKIVYIIGGKRTYEFLEPIVDTIVYTRIHENYDGDTKINIKELTKDFDRVSYKFNNDEGVAFELYKRKLNFYYPSD